MIRGERLLILGLVVASSISLAMFLLLRLLTTQASFSALTLAVGVGLAAFVLYGFIATRLGS